MDGAQASPDSSDDSPLAVLFGLVTALALGADVGRAGLRFGRISLGRGVLRVHLAEVRRLH